MLSVKCMSQHYHIIIILVHSIHILHIMLVSTIICLYISTYIFRYTLSYTHLSCPTVYTYVYIYLSIVIHTSIHVYIYLSVYLLHTSSCVRLTSLSSPSTDVSSLLCICNNAYDICYQSCASHNTTISSYSYSIHTHHINPHVVNHICMSIFYIPLVVLN